MHKNVELKGLGFSPIAPLAEGPQDKASWDLISSLVGWAVGIFSIQSVSFLRAWNLINWGNGIQ